METHPARQGNFRQAVGSERGRVKVGTAATATVYTGTFHGTADQVSPVRREVARHLGDCPVTNDAVLIVSELATNAILHSRSRRESFTIRIELHPDHLRVECYDSGGPWRSRRQDDRPHGLNIVEALTGPDSWGIETTGDGNRIVWARLTW
jgi:anti-sigma regulatory factor (Ser/Thr protein kinase)